MVLDGKNHGSWSGAALPDVPGVPEKRASWGSARTPSSHHRSRFGSKDSSWETGVSESSLVLLNSEQNELTNDKSILQQWVGSRWQKQNIFTAEFEEYTDRQIAQHSCDIHQWRSFAASLAQCPFLRSCDPVLEPCWTPGVLHRTQLTTSWWQFHAVSYPLEKHSSFMLSENPTKFHSSKPSR